MTTFVSLGTSRKNFDRLVECVEQALDLLPKPIVIQAGHTLVKGNWCESFEFVDAQRYNEYIEKSNVVIMQAGGGGVLGAIEHGKLPIVMPRLKKYFEAIDDHQISWAKVLEKSGKVIVVNDLLDLKHAIERIKMAENQNYYRIENSSLYTDLDESFREFEQQFKSQKQK